MTGVTAHDWSLPLADPAERADHPLASLRSIVQRARRWGAAEQCDMCAIDIGSQHRHVVDVEARSLRCLCSPCYLLFSDQAAAQGKFRQVPDRYRRLADVHLSTADWDELQIPVSLAFFFESSSVGQTVAFYPGPAGATESLLSLEQWQRLTERHSELGEADPDVEAVLIRRRRQETDCYLVPIDICYELVGTLRMSWVGFDGGAEAEQELARFFERIEERSGA